MGRIILKIIPCLLLATAIFAGAQQEPKPEEKKPAAGPISPAARLAFAKTALLKKAGNGNNIAYDVVSSTLDGWGRFSLVNAPDKADVIIEVYSVEESGGGVSASVGPEGNSRPIGRRGPVTPALIKLTVYDAKTHVPLWTAAERPKGSAKKVDRENNEVEAAQRLVTKFHDDLEPPPK